jgi:hypothetical protein
MILEDMFRRYKVLTFLKNGLTEKGYGFQQLTYINSQLELLNELIKKGSLETLTELLKEKTYYRWPQVIKKGQNNLIDIVKYHENWRLCVVNEHQQEWLNDESLIFSTDRETLCFTKNNYGMRYEKNKWQ